MFPKLDEELHFGYQRNGSLVLARGPEEEEVLQELMDRGRQNGVKRLKILKRDEVLAMEPHVHEAVTAALYAPDAGNLIPYEYAIALAENAVDNGVELRIRYVAYYQYQGRRSNVVLTISCVACIHVYDCRSVHGLPVCCVSCADAR
jgi:glycine/D-amino acid oxidase-like deaminating enzyme